MDQQIQTDLLEAGLRAEARFRDRVRKIQEAVVDQVPDQEKAVTQVLLKLVQQALENKKSGKHKFPAAYTEFVTWLSGDRWYWPICEELRLAVAEFLEIPIEPEE